MQDGEAVSGVQVPVDHVTRRRVRTSLDRTIFTVAGAGSGKTRHLVERVCELVVRGHARIDQLAIITFTEAAAAELRDRVAELLETTAKSVQDPVAAQRAADALGALDGAAITTLHGFARRILASHPFEAGLPATFEVMDEARSLADLDEQWHGSVTALLDVDETARAMMWLIAMGVDVRALRPVLRQLGENWDRIAPRAPAGAPCPLPRLGAADVLLPLSRALALSPCCTDQDDSLLRHLESLGVVVQQLRDAEGDDLGILRVLHAPPVSFGAGNKGRAGSWGGKKPEVKELLEHAQEARRALVGAAVDAALRWVVTALGELTLDAARRRRHEGRLHYHDLLVLACALVREDDDVRVSLHEEFRAILVDEFQDTDPLQAELVCMIAAEPTAAVGQVAWHELPIADGALFFVGDPLQSIYGFRRADIATFLRARAEVAQDTASLVTNFRSVSGIVGWVNAVFGALVGTGVGTLQPAHEPSVPARPELPTSGGSTGGDIGRGSDGHGLAPSRSVTVLGAGGGGAQSAEEARVQESQELAALLARAVAEGWPIGRGGRPAQPDDIAVLVPSRRSVPALEAAFDAVELPYRLESSSLVYGAPEVADLLNVLRAIDDPSDSASVVAALRTPGFACGDDDLVSFRLSGGTWDYRAIEPSADAGADLVRSGLAELRSLHEARAWMGVSELVGRVIEDRRQFTAALDSRRWREEWRRLRFVADQARQFAESSSGGLREYLSWVQIQCEDEARVTEVVLPEADAPAVAVMTVHGAKGLEFPVVAVVGLGVAPRGTRYPSVLFGPAGVEIGVKSTRCTAGFGSARERDELVQAHERLRLLYVAVTRAQNHLVVSVHRGPRATRSIAACLDEVLDAAQDLWVPPDVPPALGDPAVPDVPTVPEAAAVGDGRPAATWAGTPEELDHWARKRTERLSPARRVVAATSVASLATEEPSVTGEPGATPADVGRAGDVPAGDPTPQGPESGTTDEDGGGAATAVAEGSGGAALWRRGRAGTAVGRAVHAVLQTVDLATGERLEAMAAAHATREGVPDRVREVAEMARVALDSAVVRRAVAGRYWRELYVGVPVGTRVLEGFVDLLFEGPDGLEVVDYKTDRIGATQRVEDLVQRYRLQGAAYAYAVGAVTGREVAGCTFLFLRGDTAAAGAIPDLAAATADVVRLMHGDLPATGVS